MAGTRPGGRPLFLKRVKKRGKRIAPRCTGLPSVGCPRSRRFAGPASQTSLRRRTATPDFSRRTFLRSAAQRGLVRAISMSVRSGVRKSIHTDPNDNAEGTVCDIVRPCLTSMPLEPYSTTPLLAQIDFDSRRKLCVAFFIFRCSCYFMVAALAQRKCKCWLGKALV